MKGMREIRNRIKAVKSTGQITHAMELVASSKMKKAQQAAESGHPYTSLLMDFINLAAENAEYIENKRFFTNPDCRKRLVTVFSTDRGLCGALNSNLFKKVLQLEGDCCFIAVGKRAERFLARTGREVVNVGRISDKVKFSETRRIGKYAIKLAHEGKIGSIEALYPMYVNTLRQDSTLVKLAPVDALDEFVAAIRKVQKLPIASRVEDCRQITFEPSAKAIFASLPLYYFNHALYQIALDAKASEQSARRVAMKSASDNADALVCELTLEYNKARQSAITTEILELSASGGEGD